MKYDANQQIRHLEGIVRQSMDALELCALFEDKQNLLNNIKQVEDIFAHTASILQKIMSLESHAFFVVDDVNKDLRFHHCQPPEHQEYVQELFEDLIDSGNVAWALRENRMVSSTSRDGKYDVLMHAITTRKKTHGIFLVFLERHAVVLNNINSILFSILMKSTAFAYENFMLYSQIDEQNEELNQMVQRLNQEIEQKENIEQELRRSEIIYRNVFENTGNPTIIVDASGRIDLVNSQFVTFSGYEKRELVGRKKIFDFFESDSVCHEFESLLECDSESILQEKQELVFYDKRQAKYYVLLYVFPLGIDNSFIVSFSDISKIKSAEEKLNFQAYHDTLTRLPNRAFLEERLQSAIQKSLYDTSYNYAVVFIDIDRLKTINDTMGHAAGDEMIVAAAAKIHSCIRDVDTLARFGGDEFVVLLEGVKQKKDCELIMQRLYNEFKSPVTIQDKGIVITFSSGIYFGTKENVASEEVVRCADISMYQAKKKGRNKYEYYDHEEGGLEVERLHLEHDLLRALSTDEIFLNYQPIVDLDTHRLHGLEVLVRWKHPGLGLIPPAEFIPIAENTGLIIPLGKKILSLAFEQFGNWIQTYPEFEHVYLSVNLSAKQLANSEIIADLKQFSAENQVPLHRLHLEITESFFLDHNKENELIVEEMNRLGVTITIDDFGIGYSSLNYLDRFAIDAVKIDRGLIHKMAQNETSLSIIESMVSLGRKLDLHVVAEGIEVQEQLSSLLQLKCHLGQGYLFSKPLTAQNMEQFMRRSTSFQSADVSEK